MDLFLNISCEPTGPQGTNCIRISIEGHMPDNSNNAGSSHVRIVDTQRNTNEHWGHTMDNVPMDSQSFNTLFLAGINHDSIASYTPQSHLSAHTPFPIESSEAMTIEPSHMLNFDWAGLSTPSDSMPDPHSLSLMSFLSPEQLSKMEGPSYQHHEHLESRPNLPPMDVPSFTHATQDAERPTLLQSPEAKTRFSILPSPPESSACSEAAPEDKEMHSDSETDEDKDREELREGESMEGDDLRRFPCRREGCDSRFVREYTRKLHEKTHKPKPPRVFTCSIPSCNVKTSRRHDLLRHEVRKHGKKSNWQCEFCQTFFSSEKTQERHTCSKKIIQTNKSGGSTGCWKLPRQPVDEHV
ncbi:hypothetical protein CPC08DRAFT_710496 [Agrocybe pediades]|nr:hypothetical protein CPC08DRAFT_710496 [Agrocybe pediades]